MTVRVAGCAYPIDQLRDVAAFVAKQTEWVARAAEGGAQLLVFPEYGSLELSACLPAAERGELSRELAALQPLLPQLIETFSALAQKHQVHILAPSFPEFDAARSSYHNRARLHTPSGAIGIAEKVHMTRFERETWSISAGSRPAVFDTTLGKLGVAICYDSEFPLLVRSQIEAGAQVILVPSCTDGLAGYHRVALSCRARALENQCYVLQSSSVGRAPWSLAIDINRGAAGIYGPVDHGFACDGVIAQGEIDVPGWIHAELDLGALDAVRNHGQVTNHADWKPLDEAQLIALR